MLKMQTAEIIASELKIARPIILNAMTRRFRFFVGAADHAGTRTSVIRPGLDRFWGKKLPKITIFVVFLQKSPYFGLQTTRKMFVAIFNVFYRS